MNKKSVLVLVGVLLVGLWLFPTQDEMFGVVKTPTFMEVGGFWHVYMEFTTLSSMVNEKIAYFRDECHKQGIDSNMTWLVFYNWSDEEGAQTRWDVSYILPGNTDVKPPLKIGKFKPVKTLAYTHAGPYTVEAINKSYDLLKEHLKAKGLKPVHPEYELILKEPRQMNIYTCWED
jgi:effector-binding domain-containing protein